MSLNNVYQPPQAELVDPSHAAGQLGDIQSHSTGQGATWLGDAWRLFKKQPGLWVGMIIVYFILLIVLSMIPIINFLTSIITPVLTGGWMIAAVNSDTNSNATLEDLFAGFKQNAGPLFLVGLISLGLELVIFAVMGIVIAAMLGINEFIQFVQDPQDMSQIMPVVGLLVLLYLAILVPIIMMIWFAPVLIVQHKLGAWESMMLSLKGCAKNVMPFLLYSIITLFLCIVAMIPLGLGMLIVTPVIILSIYTSYKDIYLQ